VSDMYFPYALYDQDIRVAALISIFTATFCCCFFV